MDQKVLLQGIKTYVDANDQTYADAVAALQKVGFITTPLTADNEVFVDNNNVVYSQVII